MNYTHLYLAGQGIAIGNNFCLISNISYGEYDNGTISNDSNEIPKDSHLTPLTNGIVGTQPFGNFIITSRLIGDEK